MECVTVGSCSSGSRALGAAHVRRAAELRVRGQALPGARQLLAALTQRPEVRQTVMTGNIRTAAEVKLAAFDLERELDLDSGSFGEEADEQPGLVRVALRRSDTTPAEQAALLGDTPADVRGGLAHGVRVIGVATGHTSAADLTAAGATQVLPDLADTERALRLIVG